MLVVASRREGGSKHLDQRTEQSAHCVEAERGRAAQALQDGGEASYGPEVLDVPRQVRRDLVVMLEPRDDGCEALALVVGDVAAGLARRLRVDVARR